MFKDTVRRERRDLSVLVVEASTIENVLKAPLVLAAPICAPLIATATSGDEDKTPEEPSHDLWLPENTIVIFTSGSGPKRARVMDASGDLATEISKHNSSPYSVDDRCRSISVVDPFAGTVWHHPLFADDAADSGEKERQ